MKKLRYAIFILLMLSFVSCSGQQASETDMSSGDIAAVIRQSQQELPEMTQITPEDTEFATWLSDYYFLQAEQVSDGAICYADGVEASEIAVLIMADEKDCETAGELLEEYIHNRLSVFEGYAPQQAAMVKDGIVVVNGRYIAILICPEPQMAKTAFLGCFGGGTENIGERGGGNGTGEESSGKDMESGGGGENSGKGMESGSEGAEHSSEPDGTKESGEIAGSGNDYHAEAVLEAYQSGDDSHLSERDRSILEAARDVIESEIDDDMSDYEKELAIHDYITGWSKFDYGVFGRSGSDGFTDGSDTPYGVLVDQSAMCHGYSSTFQLFMDMLDIECITVFGIPGGNGVEHSWNMVKLDGEWYCVDCAWDDPIGGSPCHTYFNVTSDYLRRGSIHRWEETFVPEATGTAYAYDH